MIIKLYTTPNKTSEIELRIYDNVSDVVVCPAEKLVNLPDMNAPDFFDHAFPTNNTPNESYWFVKPIKCYVGDEYKTIYVTNWAYICNDDGKTVEKVLVDNKDALNLV